MRPYYYFMLLLAILLCLIFASCNRPAQTSTSPVVNNSTEIKPIEKAPNTNTGVVKKKKPSPATKGTNTSYTTTPPNAVLNAFKSSYPNAREVTWIKEGNNAPVYKANFLLDKSNYTLEYNEDGKLLESKIKIAPDNLSQNIKASIQYKYPEAQIVSASTVTNINNNNLYKVIINSNGTEKELTLTENGVFVE